MAELAPRNRAGSRYPPRVRMVMTIVGGLALLGCEPELGECDPVAARRVAYHALESEDGSPPTGTAAYEGQALLIQSCGYGSFCHGAELPPENRRGVPEGLTFDVQLAAADGTVDDARVARLRRGRFRVVQEAQAILRAIDDGTMPPAGDAVADVAAGAPRYASRDGEPLPAIESAQGREIVRAWLACGAPVVERGARRDDGVEATIEPPLPLPPIEPNWPSIFENLLQARGCARRVCHGSDDDPRAGYRTFSDAAQSYAALIDQPATGSECDAGEILVRPNDPDGSLLLTKLRGDASCGDPMPLGGIPLRQVELDAVSAWIACGAPEGPEGCGVEM